MLADSALLFEFADAMATRLDLERYPRITKYFAQTTFPITRREKVTPGLLKFAL
jgi:hypothetical protein